MPVSLTSRVERVLDKHVEPAVQLLAVRLELAGAQRIITMSACRTHAGMRARTHAAWSTHRRLASTTSLFFIFFCAVLRAAENERGRRGERERLRVSARREDGGATKGTRRASRERGVARTEDERVSHRRHRGVARVSARGACVSARVSRNRASFLGKSDRRKFRVRPDWLISEHGTFVHPSGLASCFRVFRVPGSTLAAPRPARRCGGDGE